MKILLPFTAALLTLLTASLAASDKAKTVWSFDDDVPGEVAKGFKSEVGEWKVVVLKVGGGALGQRAKSPNRIFNVVLASDTKASDVDLSVRFHALAGNDDQGGGLIWRARDKDNYYIARYNPLEDNFRVYYVKEGKRTQLKSADTAHTDGWHTLRVTMRGGHIECYYDGKKYLEADDDTFTDAGMIGLWSKADAQTDFDDLTLVE
ncbi:MAG TPA: family 16 glycoside hydrolase [Pirellulales bacterium]|nr:family 16 glycoside hydrolase [Pirellulales bacterium]